MTKRLILQFPHVLDNGESQIKRRAGADWLVEPRKRAQALWHVHLQHPPTRP
jgi:hypothetical protein